MKRHRNSILAGLLLLLLAAECAAQTGSSASSPPSPAQAIAADRQRVESNPSDGGAWEKLGTDYLLAGKYAEAIEPLQKALDNGVAAAVGKYNLACAYARLGEKTKALDLLESLATAGFPAQAVNDPDLAALAGEPRFQQLLAASQRATEPCKDAQAHPEYRQLDFWVGEWDVFSGRQKVGESSVQLILKDCVVFENWTGLQGGSGKSFNKYNNASRQWEQFWVSDGGVTNYFRGGLVDGEMRYTVEIPVASGGTYLRHLTFSKLPEGKVRQFSQRSTDGGKTWVTEYDFAYVKKQ
jgi:tetratricopeptide (TPR) repeat protein